MAIFFSAELPNQHTLITACKGKDEQIRPRQTSTRAIPVVPSRADLPFLDPFFYIPFISLYYLLSTALLKLCHASCRRDGFRRGYAAGCW